MMLDFYSKYGISPWQVPQMAPMNWCLLYILFLTSLSFILTKLYFVK